MIERIGSYCGSAHDIAAAALRDQTRSLAADSERLVSGSSETMAEDAVRVRIDSLGINIAVKVLKASDEATKSLIDLIA